MPDKSLCSQEATARTGQGTMDCFKIEKGVHQGCILSPAYLTYTQNAVAAAKLRQSRPTLCDPIDGSPPGSPVPGILQARTLERVVISFSNAWKWKVKVKSLSRVWLFVTPWTAVYQAPPSMGFSRQEYWSGLPLPSPYMQNTSCEMPNWMKHKLESRLPGKISIASDMQMTPSLWQKVKRN